MLAAGNDIARAKPYLWNGSQWDRSEVPDGQVMTCKKLPGLDRSIVLVGLMGAGKTSVGRRLAKALDLPFVDADQEIEEAAGCTIEDYFAEYGEAAFREGEGRVIQRLLDGPLQVIATGGGAFMTDGTRMRILERGLSVWLRAELSVLVDRVGRRSGRPLLKGGDPERILAELMSVRYPVYAEADIVVDSGDVPHESVVETIIQRLRQHLGRRPERAQR